MRSPRYTVWFLFCICLIFLASPAAGGETYDQASVAFQNGDYPRAAILFQELLDNSPEWAPGYTVLGQCLYMIGQPGEAEKAIAEAEKIDSETDLYSAYMAPGQLLYKARRFSEATRPLERALQHTREGHHRSTLLKLGYAHFQAKEFNKARVVLDRFQNRYGFDADTGYYLAVACQRSGDYACAIETMQRVAESDGKMKPERKIDEQLARWSHYRALAPENRDRRDALLVEALTFTRSWLKAQPDNPLALEYHGKTLLAADDLDGLIRELAPIAQQESGNCLAATLLAKGHNNANRGEAAERWAHTAMACDPESAIAMLELAVAQVSLLRSEHSNLDNVREDQRVTRAARETLAQALTVDPSLGSRATSLQAQLQMTSEILDRTEKEFMLRDQGYRDDVTRANAEAIRQRCTNILWLLRDEARPLSQDDLAFYGENNCRQFKNR